MNSGVDATQDSIVSLATLVGALVYIFTDIRLEAYLGVIISVIIIKSGIEMLMDALGDIMGRRPDPDLSRKVRSTIQENFPVHGAYDLLMHNYGPDQILASIHVAVDDKITAAEIDNLSRDIYDKVLEETGVIMTGVGVYAVNTQDPEAVRVQNGIYEIASENQYCLQVHGLYVDTENKSVRFDAVMDFAAPDMEKEFEDLKQKTQNAFPDYEVIPIMDLDVSD